MKATTERERKHGEADHKGEDNDGKRARATTTLSQGAEKNQEHSEAAEANPAPRANEASERAKTTGRKGHVQMFKRTNKIKEAAAPKAKSKTVLERSSTKTLKSVRAEIISRRNSRLTATLTETSIAVENTTTAPK